LGFEQKNGQWLLKHEGGEWPLTRFLEGEKRPFYLYDLNDARARARAFLKSGAKIHYAMKANSHSRLLKMFAAEGLGADVVSLGEFQKALACGFAPENIIFSGVGKGREELEFACAQGVSQVNVESFEELKLLGDVAQGLNRPARAALRINIHVVAPTHKNIQTATEESKFGLDVRQLPEALDWLKGTDKIQFVGLAVHVGSQIMDVGVFREVSAKMNELVSVVRGRGLQVETLDLGGGLGLDYHEAGDKDLSRLPDYFAAIMGHKPCRVLLEPGRFLVARMGLLAGQVVHVKRGINRQFAILNAGMNALMRPALYQAYHRIELISRQPGPNKENYTVVGPLCESTDTFAENRELPQLQPGDWIGIFDAAAYGAVMANTYNEMPRPAEWTALDGQIEVL
jgi:diaminopimelate decarboxylase